MEHRRQKKFSFKTSLLTQFHHKTKLLHRDSSLQGVRRKITGCKPADFIDTGDPMEHRCQKSSIYTPNSSPPKVNFPPSKLPNIL